LRVRSHLQGVLVVGSRPGEHYATEERELLAHVAHEVGTALFALRAQAIERERDDAQAHAKASDDLLQAARKQVEAIQAREAALLEALRTLGAASKA
jgi:predicted kinase